MSNNPFTVTDTASSPDGAGLGFQEGSGWTSGAGIIDSGSQTITALCNGDWVDAALSGVALVLDAAATAADPLGSVFAAGIGWLIDHLNPIKGWFEEVAGNPGGAVAQAQTWGLISAGLTPAGADWDTSATNLMKPQSGPAVEAYVGWQETHTAAIAQLVDATNGMQNAISVAAGVVGFVHGFLRDILAQLVGAALSWLAEAFLSLGTLIPWICAQIGTRVAAVTAKCSNFVTGIVRSGSKLGDLLKALGTWGKNLLKFLDKIKANPNLRTAPSRHAGPPGPIPDIPPWQWKPPEGFNPNPGRHAAPMPTFAEAMADGGRGAVRDSPYTAGTNSTDGAKSGLDAQGEPEK
ncbi:hypothetical protein V6K52_14105 [Knoellia sp. S7-12]|uniref:hypothetical protein n=1 Tax=Knoellia sp. S7-12 TaxID=3126698 RepID=UPI003368DD88